jgi:predicted transcriptional regulator YdeE
MNKIMGWLARLALLLAATVTTRGGTMTQQMADENGFTVVGIAARTSNAKEATPDGIIPKQWDKFIRDGLLEKIPNKVDPAIYVLYTAYASDRNGEYDFVIGARVGDGSAIPSGMVVQAVPAGRYAVLTSAKGPVGKVVVEAWQKIWSLEDQSQLGGKRTYKTDFELYDQRSRDPQNSQVDIYIGVR